MNIIRRSPSALSGYRPRTMDDPFGRLVENVFEEMFAPFTQAGGMSALPMEGAISPRINVSETDKEFDIQVEMPGVKKEDIKVAVDRQRITIEGEVKREETQREGENVLYSERVASKFMRSFVLPTEVEDANAQARMENGILSLTLPKRQGTEAKRITIQ